MVAPKPLIKYIGLFALCGWMFFIGILVGRGTAPVKFETQGFQERLGEIFEEAEKNNSVQKKKPDLDFYDALKKPDDNGDFSLDVPEVAEPITIKVAPFEENTIEIDTSQNQEEKPEELQYPLKRSKKAMSLLANGRGENSIEIKNIKNNSIDIKSNKTGASNKTGKAENINKTVKNKEKSNTTVKTKDKKVSEVLYAIQLASYNDLEIALKHISKLQSKGYAPYKTSVKIKDKLWYRVRIGSFTDIEKAKNFLNKLGSDGFKGIVTKKN